MDTEQRKRLGSETAKSGFKFEKVVENSLLNFRINSLGKDLLIETGIDIENIIDIEKLPKRNNEKSDVRVLIKLKNNDVVFNISCKSYGDASFNQIDKRPVNKYAKIFNFPDEVTVALKKFTGEINDGINKRKYFDQLLKEERRNILDYFKKISKEVIELVFIGNGSNKINWVVLRKKETSNEKERINIIPVSFCTAWANGEVRESKIHRGHISTFSIGKIKIQRKGGTPDPNSLQFKFSPGDLHEAYLEFNESRIDS